MKKIILTMASAMVFMSMVAAPGADKKNALKTPVSRADLVTQTEALMSALCSDGFGLDAEEYELLMGQDLDLLDDLAGSFTMPSCASETPSLNGARPTRPFDPPIGPGPIKTLSGCSSGSGNGNFDQVGTARPDVVPSLNSARPTQPFDPTPIGNGPIKLNAVGGSGSGSFDQVGTARPDVVPSLNSLRPTDPARPPIGPGPKVHVNGCSGSGDFSGDSSIEDMIKGNVRPNSQPSLNGGRPTKPIGPGPIDF